MGRVQSVRTAGAFGSWWHLAGRFFLSLAPVGPRRPAELWALDQLSPSERPLFAAMSGPDRRHAIGVARRAMRLAGGEEVPEGFVAAALLHDVGKIEASLGTFGRVFATVAAVAVGRQRLADFEPPAGAGAGAVARWRRRVARYLRHDAIGAGLLQEAGSSPLTVGWAREHHLAESRWTVDLRLGRWLKLADGD